MEVTLKGHLTHSLHIAKIISRALENKMCAIFFIISRKLNSTPIFGNELWWLTGFLEFPKIIERDLHGPLSTLQAEAHSMVDEVTWESIRSPFGTWNQRPDICQQIIPSSAECCSQGLPLSSFTLIYKRECNWVEWFTRCTGNKPPHSYSFLPWVVVILEVNKTDTGISPPVSKGLTFHSHNSY